MTCRNEPKVASSAVNHTCAGPLTRRTAGANYIKVDDLRRLLHVLGRGLPHWLVREAAGVLATAVRAHVFNPLSPVYTLPSEPLHQSAAQAACLMWWQICSGCNSHAPGPYSLQQDVPALCNTLPSST